MQKGPLRVNQTISLHFPKSEFAKPLFEVIDNQRTYLRQYLPWIDNTQNAKDVQKFIRNEIIFNKGGQRLTTFIFFEQKIIGSIGLISLNKAHCRAEIGYWLHQDYQGQGIMTAACQRIIQYGFTQLQLNRLVLKVFTDNNRSLAIAERLGFTYEGTLRSEIWMHGQFHDIKVFALLQDEWE